ncbi:hypothetical protein HMPREF0868_0328 [Mageeibacillus indolicus UPII9-5]|uniref:Uncharacterized protein n=2 Tax=Mageeibacillus indolicus TaxID=884684 RepID=D3R0F9_MAGIU|nr:hypothetical protein HMPREF0868_0328 [Mageeibacillus indolicus UPII9-5]PNH18805.1 hypothetical protein B7R76_04435 [Mageeibacillus indolicus]
MQFYRRCTADFIAGRCRQGGVGRGANDGTILFILRLQETLADWMIGYTERLCYTEYFKILQVGNCS